MTFCCVVNLPRHITRKFLDHRHADEYRTVAHLALLLIYLDTSTRKFLDHRHADEYRTVVHLALLLIYLQSMTKFIAKRQICGKIAFPMYTESVKFRSQYRETASKRKPYRGLGTR